jgi:hypothetical protein
MAQTRLNRRNTPVIIALVILLIFGIFTVIMLVQFANPPQMQVTPEPVSAQSYRERVDALLAIAQPENGEAVTTKYVCIACHIDGNNTLAPEFAGLAERAAERRPPLPADGYIYESIVYPGEFVVEGYNDVMPHDFGAKMTDQELADVLAYLLMPAAQ